VTAVEINDVFLIEARCNVSRDFNQTELARRIAFQHRLTPDGEGVFQIRNDALSGTEINIIRYFIDGGLRVLRPGATSNAATEIEFKPEDVLAEILVKIAVDYNCPKALLEDRDAIGAFSKNAVFHAWPYWRSIVHSFSDQMRLPRVTIPMLRQHALAPMALADSTAGGVSGEGTKAKRPKAKKVTLRFRVKNKRGSRSGAR
jgi:hypothetical protein